MSRIPTHSVEDAPAASRPLLQKIVQATPGGRPANLHAQMAHSPAVLTAYTSLRAVLAEHTKFDPNVGAALTLAAAAGVGNGYMVRIAIRLARMSGWDDEQVAALRSGTPTNQAKIDALAGLVREAAANSGNVTERHLEDGSANRLERCAIDRRVCLRGGNGVQRTNRNGCL
jgi:hypothetical protein